MNPNTGEEYRYTGNKYKCDLFGERAGASLEATEESAESGSEFVNQWKGSADPNRYQNVMNPEHWKGEYSARIQSPLRR
jgi:hypothetical protein